MTLEHLIEYFTKDSMAVLLFFMILPILVVILNGAAAGQGNSTPYDKMYSIIVYVVSVPGILSITVWMYSMFFEHKSLWKLDPFVYYLPVASMAACLILIKKNARFKDLPWFGEFYELMILIFVTFMSILMIMELDILHFKAIWQVALVFIFLFGLLKVGWERFQRLTS